MILVLTRTDFGLPSRSNCRSSSTRKQFDLHVEREVADLVQENRGAIGQLESSDLARQRTRIRASFPSEQLTLQQRRRNGGAVDAHHGARRTRAQAMDFGCEHLLAAARLAKKEHGRIGCRDMLDLLQSLAHCRAPPDDACDAQPRAHFEPRVPVLDRSLIGFPNGRDAERVSVHDVRLGCVLRSRVFVFDERGMSMELEGHGSMPFSAAVVSTVTNHRHV